MRCLFCDKELPLFKRLTGGEFCSDTHRRQYQQEYSQLALNRLLQAKPPEDRQKPDQEPAHASSFSAKQALNAKQVQAAKQMLTAKPAPTLKPAMGGRPLPAAKQAPLVPPKPSTAPPPANSVARNGAPNASAAAAVAEPPPSAGAAPSPQPEAVAPASVAGPVKYRPAPAAVKSAAPAMAEIEPAASAHPAIPHDDVTPPGVRLESANRLSYAAIANPLAVPWRARHDRLEVRDFTRTNPILDLGARLGEPWMGTATEPVELSFTASNREESPWVQPHVEFGVRQVQVGELATHDLATTGFEISAASESPIAPVEVSSAEVAAPKESVPARLVSPAVRLAPAAPLSPAASVMPAVPATSVASVMPAAPITPAAPVMPAASITPAAPVTPAEPAAPGPQPATQPMPVVLQGIPGGKARPVQVFASMLRANGAAQIPRYDSLPLRAKMVLRRADAPSPKTGPAKIEPAETVKIESAEPAAKAAKTNTAGTPEAPARAGGKHKLDTDPRSGRQLPEPIEVAWEQIKLNREQADLNRQQADLNRQQAELIREQVRTAPKVAAEDASGSPAAASPSAASTPPVAGPLKPEQATPEQAKPEQAKPQQAKPEQARPAPKSTLSLTPSKKLEENDLGLPKLDLAKAKGREPLWIKITAAAACALLLTGGIWFYMNHAGSPETPAISSLSAGAGQDWIENFSPDARHPRTISVLRASAELSDYTVEFSASIDVKALGWVFRAKDPANFYVGRIEQQKTLGGTVAVFVYFPVVKGVAQERKSSPVGLPAAPGTVYKVRFEASGERFTAWIQDRKIEEWTDGRLLSGGAGLYSESGERALLESGFHVIPRTAVSK